VRDCLFLTFRFGCRCFCVLFLRFVCLFLFWIFFTLFVFWVVRVYCCSPENKPLFIICSLRLIPPTLTSRDTDVITWGRSLWILCVDRSGCSMTYFYGATLWLSSRCQCPFWLRSRLPRPCSGRALLRTDSSVAQSKQCRYPDSMRSGG
jgi:hypothetical protein